MRADADAGRILDILPVNLDNAALAPKVLR